MSKKEIKAKDVVIGNEADNNVIAPSVEATETEQTESVAQASAEASAIPNSYTNEKGHVYVLSPRTPKTLAVLEDVYTQEELLKNKEAMEFLILGDSGFVKRIK